MCWSSDKPLYSYWAWCKLTCIFYTIKNTQCDSATMWTCHIQKVSQKLHASVKAKLLCHSRQNVDLQLKSWSWKGPKFIFFLCSVFLYVYLFIVTILTVLQNLCTGFSLLWSNQLWSLTCLKPNLNCFVWLLKINGRTLVWSHACHCLGKDRNFSSHYILQNSILFIKHNTRTHTHTHTHKQTQNDMFHAGTLVGPKMPVSANKNNKNTK